MVKNDPKPKPKKFDREKFKKAIAWVESSGGKNLSNPTSSAAGKYHFLYKYIKDIPSLKGVTKLEFMNSPELQENVMDMALDGKLKGFPNYIKYSNEIKKMYGSDLRHEEVAALTHFLGIKGVKNYLKDKSSFVVPGKNASVDQYLEKFRGAYGPVESGYEMPQREKLKKNVNLQQRDNIPKIPVQRNPVPMQVPGYDNSQFVKTEYKAAPGGEGTDALSVFSNPKAYGGKTNSNTRMAYGGEVNSVNDLVKFEEGGTHEQNPYGGLPIGRDGNGTMNTVEEGETKFTFDDGDYIFSDRIGLNSTK